MVETLKEVTNEIEFENKLKEIAELKAQVERLHKVIYDMRDGSKALIYAALSSAQGEFPTITKLKAGVHNSVFATHAEMVLSVQPILTKYSLSVTHTEDIIDGLNILITTLGHKSGQSIVSRRLTKNDNNQKNEQHAEGGALTYFRRYTYAAILGLVPEENDGAAYPQN